MARWSEAGLPHKGWECVSVEDSREEGCDADDPTEDYPACEMCDHERIRWVHVLRHADHPDEIRVGCVCAGALTGEPVAAKARETCAKNRASRRGKWLNRKWRTSARGNDFLNVQGHNVVVFDRDGGRWSFRVDGVYGRGHYPSQDEAKLAAFDALFPRGRP